MPDSQDLTTPTNLSHPLVDEARDSLMRAVAYLKPDERADVLRACHFGDVAHIKDKRKSGEPYITHPIAVAEILAGFRLDRDTIVAAILHDTIEDTEVTDGFVKRVDDRLSVRDQIFVGAIQVRDPAERLLRWRDVVAP